MNSSQPIKPVSITVPLNSTLANVCLCVFREADKAFGLNYAPMFQRWSDEEALLTAVAAFAVLQDIDLVIVEVVPDEGMTGPEPVGLRTFISKFPRMTLIPLLFEGKEEVLAYLRPSLN